MLTMFIKGLIIGVIVSAPIGPIGILSIQRTLNGGRRRGIATALGASCSDLLYACIAVFSMSMVVSFIETHQYILQIIGTIAVFFFGLYTFMDDPRKKLTKMKQDSKDLNTDFLTSFGLTFTNPLVIVLFMFLFAKFNYITEDMTFFRSILSIVFIMLGAAFWWSILVYVVDLFRGKFNVRGLYIVNKVTGILLMIIAPISLIFTLIG
ncbi:MAG: LysE family transporter [Paludibacteraceae bacterium]|mgnify:CR=1 FL=1|nr:LysE family transporter [Paludibacteraceae bacterium]